MGIENPEHCLTRDKNFPLYKVSKPEMKMTLYVEFDAALKEFDGRTKSFFV